MVEKTNFLLECAACLAETGEGWKKENKTYKQHCKCSDSECRINLLSMKLLK